MILAAVFIFLAFIIVKTSSLALISSPLGQFNVTYLNNSDLSFANINYTNNYRINITFISNSSSWDGNTLEILNDTQTYPSSKLSENYSQGNTVTDCQRIGLVVQLENGTQIINITSISSAYSTNVTLIFRQLSCKPGKYYTDKFTIRNISPSFYNETANLTFYLDIPISTDNTFNNQTGIGTFNGSMPINATTYHSYYFNATTAADSMLANSIGLVVNLVSSADIDVFLLDNSGVLRAKSINKTANNEWLVYGDIPTDAQMWEIRIFGNSTSAITYGGSIIFTTMNATDTSDLAISSLDFGVINVTGNSTKYIRLANEGNITISSVTEQKRLYQTRRFSGAGDKNFTIFVPDSSYVESIEVKMNWNGGSNYSLYLYNHTGMLVTSSTGVHRYANISGVEAEERLETRSLSSAANYWTVSVRNNTNETHAYNVTVREYLNFSAWIVTNASALNFLNRTGEPNASSDIRLNFTVPTSAWNGSYEGYVLYTTNTGGALKLPIKIDVTTPMLLVNNTTTSTSYRLDENYGANLTRIMYFKINNIGSLPLGLTVTNSMNLSCGDTSYKANLTHNISNSIPANSYILATVNITFNSSFPACSYQGWIFLNSTDVADQNLTSHPYATNQISLSLNLTNLLDVRLQGIETADGDREIENISNGESLTLKINVYYINGIGPITNLLNISNFTSVYLQETNVTSSYGMIPTSGSLNITNGTAPGFYNNMYNLNATTLANKPGGLYNVYATASVKQGDFTYTGTGANGTINLNQTGLYITVMPGNSTSFTVSNDSSKIFAVNVSNYGLLAASGVDINLVESCSGWALDSSTPAAGIKLNCPGSSLVPAAQNTTCMVYWKINGGSSASSACSGNVTGTPASKWFNPNEITVSVTVSLGGDGSTTATTGAAAAATNASSTARQAAKHMEITAYPGLVTLVQGTSKSSEVVVKNINYTMSQDIKLAVEGDAAKYTTVTPGLVTAVAPQRNASFTVTFTVPTNATIGEFTGTFKAISNYANVSQVFTLKITPKEETKTEINTTLATYIKKSLELEQALNASKAKGGNTTEVEALYATLKEKIIAADNYIAQGNYNAAYGLFSEIESMINQVQTELNKVKEQQAAASKIRWWYVVVIAVGGGVGGILAYLFWPTKETKPKPSYDMGKSKTETREKPAEKRNYRSMFGTLLKGPEKEEIEKPSEVKLRLEKEREGVLFDKLKQKISGLRKKKDINEYKGNEE
jgi:hypothetical protein